MQLAFQGLDGCLHVMYIYMCLQSVFKFCCTSNVKARGEMVSNNIDSIPIVRWKVYT